MPGKRGGKTRQERTQYEKTQRLYIPKHYALRTMEEVAQIMAERGYPMSKNCVCLIEGRALFKIRKALQGAEDRMEL